MSARPRFSLADVQCRWSESLSGAEKDLLLLIFAATHYLPMYNEYRDLDDPTDPSLIKLSVDLHTLRGAMRELRDNMKPLRMQSVCFDRLETILGEMEHVPPPTPEQVRDVTGHAADRIVWHAAMECLGEFDDEYL